MNRLLCCTLFLAGVAVTGCGGKDKLHQVEGTVTVDSQPLEGAMVIFTNGSVSATGLTTASGKFKLMTAGKEGAPAGTYKVTVTKDKLKSGTGTGAPYEGSDPTKGYQDYLKANNAKTTSGPGGSKLVVDKPKSEIPDRYKQTGSLPDQTVPPSGEITIELKSK